MRRPGVLFTQAISDYRLDPLSRSGCRLLGALAFRPLRVYRVLGIGFRVYIGFIGFRVRC